MGDAWYHTVEAKAGVARVLTWAVAIGEQRDLEEAEQLAREAAVDGLKYDEKSPSGNYNAYFRAIWASALILHRDAGSLAFADRLLRQVIDGRRGMPPVAWCDGYIQLVLGQLLQARSLGADADEAFGRAAAVLDQLQDPLHPMHLTLHDVRALGGARHP